VRGILRPPAVAVALALLAAPTLCGRPPGAGAATLAGSPHDFSPSGPAPNELGRNGSCAACHRPHAAAPGTWLWSRPLADEDTFFNQKSTPNYVPGSTILCYDCHDDNPARSGTLIDNDPPRTLWAPLHIPQNIAFTDVVPGDYTGTPTQTGYYELINGVVPSLGNHGPVDGTPTGGHYWKADRPGTPDYRRGDKIACSFCHDPHNARTGSNQAMILTAAGDGGAIPMGNGLQAARPPNTRNGSGSGREMCAACHAYAQTGTPATFRSIVLPRPPVSVAEHLEPNPTPCTNCHKHNRITAGCDGCHGYPPTTVGNGWSGPGDTDENYPGGAGAHLAHMKGSGKSATDPVIYDFGCLGGACHPGNLHDQGGGVVSRANVQVAFDAAWNPNGVFGPGGTALADACTQLYCHSNGLVENGLSPVGRGSGEAGPSGLGEWAEHSGKPTFFGATPASPVTWGGSLTCRGCHGKGDPNYVQMEGASTTRDAEVAAPAYLNAGQQTFVSGEQIFNTTGANSHYIHVYKAPSSVTGGCRCHVPASSPTQPAPATVPPGHVNRQVDVPYCSNQCHNAGLSTVTWGAKTGSEPADQCAWLCHGVQSSSDSPGGRITKRESRNANEVQPKYLESGHGAPTSSKYASGNSGAGLACSACHLATDRLTTNGALVNPYHYEESPASTGNPNAALKTNPYWLKSPYATDPDGLCTSCHNGTAARSVKNHTAQGMIDAGSYDPKYDTPPGTWTSFTPKCIDCHDPHGEPNLYMLYDGDPEGSYSSQTELYSGPVITKGDRYGVTRAASDPYGVPPGPPYQGSQAPVTMTAKSAGSDFVTGTGSGICEVCHTLTTFYRKDGSGGVHQTSPCSGCHTHQTAFAPATCEGCHGQNGVVSPGVNGKPGDEDDAPNVMTVNVGGKWLSVWDGTWWDQTQGGDDNTQQGGHGDPDGKEGGNADLVPKCTDCHDTSLPQPNTHFDGVYNSLGTELRMPYNPSTPRPKANPNENTAHLKAEFFTKYVSAAGNDSSWQRAMDAYCYSKCHQPNGVPAMDHSPGDEPVPGAVQLGRHLTMPSTAGIMDGDITTSAGGMPNFSPCVACHNPHGSTNTDTKGGGGPEAKNHMLVDDWQHNGSPLCLHCHL
jgi:hypothetical protein